MYDLTKQTICHDDSFSGRIDVTWQKTDRTPNGTLQTLDNGVVGSVAIKGGTLKQQDYTRHENNDGCQTAYCRTPPNRQHGK